MTDQISLEDELLVSLAVFLPYVGPQPADHQNGIALADALRHMLGQVRKQATSIQVVLPSLHPAFVLMRGVQANLNADTVPLPRVSTSVPA